MASLSDMKIKDLLSVLPEYQRRLADLKSEQRSQFLDHSLTEISNLVIDSRAVESRSVFVAMRGSQVDSHRFLPDVVMRGASALVVEYLEFVPKDYRGFVLVVKNSREALDLLASRYFGDPSQKLFVFGVTGTNGKTSCVYLFEHIFNFSGFPAGVIGTVNHHFQDKIWETGNTTPGPLELQERLGQMRELGARAVALEITSHALEQRRADSVQFNSVLFTNLTRDHLDFHKTMNHYFAAKQRLFTDLLWKSGKIPQFAIVNTDDPYGRRLKVANYAGIWTYGKNAAADFHFKILDADFVSTHFELSSPFGKMPVHLPLGGEHNVYNAVGVIAAAASLGIPVAYSVKALVTFPGVPGRMQLVPNNRNLHILVDYAHTPDALENVLKTLFQIREKNVPGKKIICVFGCGGDRDKGKRPQMGAIAEKYADYVIVTSDNPRSEDPLSIIHDIMGGFVKLKPDIESDRKKAILKATQIALPGDVVLIAGKGHENYQQIGAERIPFSDYNIVAEALV